MMTDTVKYVQIGTLHGQPVVNKIMGAGKAREFQDTTHYHGQQAFKLFSHVFNAVEKNEKNIWKTILHENKIDHIEG